MKAMFGFLTPQGKDSADPLQNAKTAAAWLRQLPSLDVIGRQQNVILRRQREAHLAERLIDKDK